MSQKFSLDCEFPGGNVRVRDTNETRDVVAISPDSSPERGDWFWFYFRVRGASGRTFMREFAIANVVALALMTVLYALLFVVKIA